MDVQTTITEFKYLLRSQGYAASTIDGYRKRLDEFAAYLAEQKISDLKTATRQVILDYREHIMGQDNAMETKAIKIRAVKRLFEHLEQTHKLLLNPTEGIVETCRKNRKPGPVLTQEQVKRLLRQPDLSSKASIRDKAIMEVLYSTGIRLNELICLEVYHTDLRDKVLYIRKGKGGKQRVVPMGADACRYLKEYLDKVRPWYARKNRKERSLFLLNTGEPMNPSSIRGMLAKYRKQARIGQSTSPHTLRRSCATHLLQNGADIRYIQKLLGHKSLKTTQWYTKVMPTEVKDTHAKTHPGIKTGS